MKERNVSSVRRAGHAAFLVGAGMLLGSIGSFLFFHSPAPVVPDIPLRANEDAEGRREQSTEFQFVSPLLSCGVEGTYSTNGDAQALREKVHSLIEKYTKDGALTDAGVYYRELNDGTWFGINEDARFTPGSLLKVPLALSVLRKAVADPVFASAAILYDGGAAIIPQHFQPAESLVLGQEYTVQDLLRIMLIYSDNIATQVLAQVISRQELDDSYIDLGIEVPTDGDSYTMSVRTYASFFRILYNGTYLPHVTSEALLATLSESTFTEGIVSGVPHGTVVSHKFGERTRAATEPAQLHDCGIVYKEKNPYALCVMLRGDDIDTLAKVIAEISKTIFEGTTRE